MQRSIRQQEHASPNATQFSKKPKPTVEFKAQQSVGRIQGSLVMSRRCSQDVCTDSSFTASIVSKHDGTGNIALKSPHVLSLKDLTPATTAVKQLCVLKLTAKLEFWYRPRGHHYSAIPAAVYE